ncbi:hypothetical protein F5Y16DRAFT_418673 [Xylariaceae sp. FL0255]|nr:hypothetical protein F5Y16DRAFT_418673 [Xylariaceae sp. FL0255]
MANQDYDFFPEECMHDICNDRQAAEMTFTTPDFDTLMRDWEPSVDFQDPVAWDGIDGSSGFGQLQNTFDVAFLQPHGLTEGAVAQGSSPASESARPENRWDYAIEVWPATSDDAESIRRISDHATSIQAVFLRKHINYSFSNLCYPSDPQDLQDYGPCRRYIIPRDSRDEERSRLNFLQVFSGTRRYNQALPGYHFKMSVVYEDRRFGASSTDSYPVGIDGRDMAHFNRLNPNGDPTLVSPTPSKSSLAPTTPPAHPLSPPDDAQVGTRLKIQPRMRSVPKPYRDVLKTADGKYLCTWPDCTESSREFSRKCEWNKHMDKHERPYKCNVAGCEKLPGFTYAGGLLRHGREVHGQHGGPKNPLYCPHQNCKRHNGKEFARLENLNEHLRRCHTHGAEASANADEPETPRFTMEPLSASLSSPKLGEKRKADNEDLREEVKRLRAENQGLKSQQAAMMQQLEELRDRLNILSER